MNKLRIGFLSTANIGRKNWKAIFSSGNCSVSAVASRNSAKSLEFIEKCQHEHPFETPPVHLGSYEELISANDVDAIYFPLPTGLRKEWVIRAAEAGKHVLCEKPCTTSVTELKQMLAACRRNRVQFLDGVMFMHNVRLPKMREILDDGKSVGSIRRISSAFSFHGGEEFLRSNIRTVDSLEPAGCLGDLGWYSLRFTLWAMNWQMPESVNGRIHSILENPSDKASPPMEFSGTLNYPNGVTAEFFSSFLASRQQWAHVSGQHGWLRLPDFVHPLNGYEPSFEVNEKFISVSSGAKCPPDTDPLIGGHSTAQDTRMWRNFANQILSGKLNDDWPMWALKTQRVMDACLESARSGDAVKLT